MKTIPCPMTVNSFCLKKSGSRKGAETQRKMRFLILGNLASLAVQILPIRADFLMEQSLV